MSSETRPAMAAEGQNGATVAAEAHGIEQRGIDFIPDSERRGKPSDLFWMWAGAL